MTNRVFVSYCRKDMKALEQFERFAKPMQRDGLIDIWHDNRIKPGQDWAAEIDKALADATTAVLFVSQDFLASAFIFEKELPAILAAAKAGRLTVLPVFLSPSDVENTPISFTDPQTDVQHKQTLDTYQGLNTPDQPLSKKSWSEKERVYQKLAGRIRELAGQSQIPPDTLGIRTAHSISRTLPDKAYTLTVELTHENGNLKAQYHRPGESLFLEHSRDWSRIAEKIQPLSQMIASGDKQAVQGLVATAPQHWGKVLFETLFGSDPNHHESLFRTAFYRPAPEPLPTPVAAPLRLRIVSEDQKILNLAWFLTTWKGAYLADRGWEFVSGTQADPEVRVKTSQPLGVLLIVPDDPEHCEAVQALFKELWPKIKLANYVRLARTPSELENALAGFSPQFVYYFGDRCIHQGRECLQLRDEAGDDPLPLEGFTKWLFRNRNSPPVVYLNAAATNAETEALYAPFEKDLPLLIWRQVSFIDDAAKSVAISWFRRWLQHGEDPTEALQQVLLSDQFRNTAELASIAVIGKPKNPMTV